MPGERAEWRGPCRQAESSEGQEEVVSLGEAWLAKPAMVVCLRGSRASFGAELQTLSLMGAGRLIWKVGRLQAGYKEEAVVRLRGRKRQG